MFVVAGLSNKSDVSNELGANQQIIIGTVSVGILLFFNFMLVLPIITSADQVFARLVIYK